MCSFIYYLASGLCHGLLEGGVVREAEGVHQALLAVVAEVVGADEFVAVERALHPQART